MLARAPREQTTLAAMFAPPRQEKFLVAKFLSGLAGIVMQVVAVITKNFLKETKIATRQMGVNMCTCQKLDREPKVLTVVVGCGDGGLQCTN